MKLLSRLTKAVVWKLEITWFKNKQRPKNTDSTFQTLLTHISQRHNLLACCMLSSSILQQIPLDTSQETEQENLPLSLHAALKNLFPRTRTWIRNTTSKNLTCKEKIKPNRVFTSFPDSTDTPAKDFLFTTVKTDWMSNSGWNISSHPLPAWAPASRKALPVINGPIGNQELVHSVKAMAAKLGSTDCEITLRRLQQT